MSVQTLAITVVAPEERFDEFIEETAPIIDSIEFHPRRAVTWKPAAPAMLAAQIAGSRSLLIVVGDLGATALRRALGRQPKVGAQIIGAGAPTTEL